MNSLTELDALVAELDLDRRRNELGGGAQGSEPSNNTIQPIVANPFFDECPRCRSSDVSTNRNRGYSVCESCGFATDPTNRVSTKRALQGQVLSQNTQNKLALLQETHLKHNQRMLQSKEQANWELFKACQRNDIATIKRLLDLGYEVNCTDTDTGSTPLHWACSKSQQHAIRFLVERGANINAQNKRGITPLHSLIINRIEPLAFWLIKKGADINITNNEGHTPVDLALPWTRTEMRELYDRVKSGLEVVPTSTQTTSTVVIRPINENSQPQQAPVASSASKNVGSAPSPSSSNREVMKIYLKNDAYKSLIVTNKTSASDICDMMAEKLNLGPGFSRNFESWERIKKDGRYLERRIPPTANLFALKEKWPLIFGKAGNETHLHCRFIVHIKNGSPQNAQVQFRDAIYGQQSG